MTLREARLPTEEFTVAAQRKNSDDILMSAKERQRRNQIKLMYARGVSVEHLAKLFFGNEQHADSICEILGLDHKNK